MFSYIAEVYQLGLSVDISFLVFEFQNFNTFKMIGHNEFIRLALVANPFVPHSIASIDSVLAFLPTNTTLRGVLSLELFHDIINQALGSLEQIKVFDFDQHFLLLFVSFHSLSSFHLQCGSSELCEIILDIFVSFFIVLLNITREVDGQRN